MMDPFTRPSPVREALVRLFARLALVWGAVYLTWRVVATLDGVAGWAGMILLAAEGIGLLNFAMMVWAAEATPKAAIDVPGAPVPDAAAVIDATGASVDALRTTLVSTRRVEGLDRIVIVDRGDSRHTQALADRFGAVIADSGASNLRTIAGISNAWVLRLSAGDLPMPDLLTICAAACSSPDLGALRFGTEDADPTSYEHDPVGGGSLAAFDDQVVTASLASRGSVPWQTDRPVLIRPAVLAMAGFADRLEDELMVGPAILGTGFRIDHVAVTLARVRGPENLSKALDRRKALLGLRVRTALSAGARTLPRRARLAYQLALLPFLRSAQLLLLVMAAVLILAFAQLPLTDSGPELYVLAGAAYGFRWIAHLLLGRGRLRPFSVLRATLRNLGVDLTLLVGTTGRRRGLGLLVAVLFVSAFAVGVTAVSVWQDRTGQLPGGTAAVAMAITGVHMGVAFEVLLDAVVRRQRRRQRRVRLGLVTCRLEEVEGQLVDLSTGGAGVLLPCAESEVPAPGAVTTIAFRIPDADGAWRSVSTLVKIAHRRAESPTETWLGLEFDDPTDAPLDPVVEFLTVERRLATLGRQSAVPMA